MSEATKQQREWVKTLEHGFPGAQIETWIDETDSTMGVAMTDDGLTQVAYVGRDGRMIGDWI